VGERRVPRNGDKLFKFLATVFDVTRAEELLGHAKLIQVNPKDFNSIIGMIRIDESRVPKVDITKPGILATFAVPQQGKPDEIFTVLIDGWHRTRRHLDLGLEEMPVYHFEDSDFVMEEFAWIRGIHCAPGKHRFGDEE
jgi:hypothetical protein